MLEIHDVLQYVIDKKLYFEQRYCVLGRLQTRLVLFYIVKKWIQYGYKENL